MPNNGSRDSVSEDLTSQAAGSVLTKFLLSIINGVTPVLVTTALFGLLATMVELKDAISDLKTQLAVQAKQSELGIAAVREALERESERNDAQDQFLMQQFGSR
jgi:hypothetical protein